MTDMCKIVFVLLLAPVLYSQIKMIPHFNLVYPEKIFIRDQENGYGIGVSIEKQLDEDSRLRGSVDYYDFDNKIIDLSSVSRKERPGPIWLPISAGEYIRVRGEIFVGASGLVFIPIRHAKWNLGLSPGAWISYKAFDLQAGYNWLLERSFTNFFSIAIGYRFDVSL